jgi:hypothetical protein
VIELTRRVPLVCKGVGCKGTTADCRHLRCPQAEATLRACTRIARVLCTRSGIGPRKADTASPNRCEPLRVGGWLGVKAIHPPLGAAQRVRSSFARCTLRFRHVPGSAHSLALKLTFSLFCPRPCSAAYTYTSIADCHTRSASALATREQLRNLAKQRIHRCVPSAQAVKRLGARVRRRQGLHAPAPTSAAAGRGLHHRGVGVATVARGFSARQILHGRCSRK